MCEFMMTQLDVDEWRGGMNGGEDTNEVSMAQSTGIVYKIYENWATLYANKNSSEFDVCHIFTS